MKLFKPHYTDRAGKRLQCRKWYLDFFDHNQLRHQIAAFVNRRESEGLARNIETLVNCRAGGTDLDAKTTQWIEIVPDSLLSKFVSWGLLDAGRTEGVKPLAEHIRDYCKVLAARGRPKDYVVRTRNRLATIVRACRFVYFRDITRSAVEGYSGILTDRTFSATTRGHYLSTLMSFMAWAEQDGRILSNPLRNLEKPKRDSEQKGVLTPEQFIDLVKRTFKANIVIDGISAADRAMLYLLAGVTGLRRKELLGLTWGNIYLGPDGPFVRVPAKLAKNAKEALQPLPPLVVGVLQAKKAEAMPSDADRVFAGLSQWVNTAAMLQRDLEAVGLPPADRDGNEICFHSLRNSYISFLANSQTPAKVVQKLARHSDPRLTFNTYARTFEDAEQKAVTFLPDCDFYFHTCFDSNRIQGGVLERQPETVTRESTPKTAFPLCQTASKIAPRGFEPLLPG